MSESMTVDMTPEQAIEFAREWQKGLTVYPGAMGWCVVCMVLADEVERLAHDLKLSRAVIKDVFDDMDCLPKCDSYGHEDECPYVEPMAAFRKLRQERDALRRRVAQLESQAQAVEDSETLAGAALMLVHDRFMRGVLTKEIMIEAVNSVGTRSIARIKADAVREAIVALDALDMADKTPSQKVGFCSCMDELEKYANQIEGWA